MRPKWMLATWILPAILFAATAVQGQQERQPAEAPPGQEADAGAHEGGEGTFQGFGGFQPRQPLSGFQPTDVGGEAAPPAEQPPEPQPEPQPPQTLQPDLNAAPVQNAEEPSVLRETPQDVAPAQFQSPAAGKTSPEPKTTIVPATNPPAFQPAGPAGAPAQPEPQSLAQSLYQQALTPPGGEAISGTPTTLQQALTQRTDPARYAEFVKSYWKLSQSLATHYEMIQGAAELARLPQPRVPYQQAMLQAAGTASEAEVRQTRLQAISAQQELAEMMAGGGEPLPVDLPLMAAYKSKFEAVFAGRVPPAGARRLHETFEPRLAVVESRAAASVAAENAFAALADAYANGQIDLDAVLREHARLQTARREFLRSVYDYNAAIADYAWLAAGPNRSPETIASMLIERKKSATAPEAAPANYDAPASAVPR